MRQESKIEMAECLRLTKKGCMVFKMEGGGGIPDRLVMTKTDKGLKAMFVEFKKKGESPTPQQTAKAIQLADSLGIAVKWFDGEYHEFDKSIIKSFD